MISSFRVFVIKNKIRHNSTLQKHEGQLSNFYFLISAFRERLQMLFPEFMKVVNRTMAVADFIL